MLKRDTATKYEIDSLEKLRDAPREQYTLTPTGIEFTRINYDLQRWRERRIDYLQTRLDVASFVMRREFDRER